MGQGWLKASRAVTVVGKQLCLVYFNAICCGTAGASNPSSSQVHLPSRQSTTGCGLVLPSRCQRDLLGGVAQRLLPTSWRAVGRRTESLVGGGGGSHLLVEQVAIAVAHHVSGGGVSVGHGGHGEGLLAAGLLCAAAAAAVAAHESGKLWLLGGGG